MRSDPKLKEAHTWGLRFTNADRIEDVADAILDGYRGTGDQLPLVLTPNVDILVTLEDTTDHVRSSVDRAAIVLPDGQPLVSFSRLAGDRLPKKLSGADLTDSIWPRLAKEGRPVFAVVCSTEVGARLAAQHQKARWIAAPILTTETGSIIDRFAYDVVKRISQMEQKPGLIFIGLSFPKDSNLARSIIDQWPPLLGEVPLIVACGASLEFVSGTKKRAPMIYQRCGIEFVYRILKEPRRLLKRYLIRDSRFLLILGRHIFGRS